MCTSDLQKVNRKEDLSNTSGPQMKILLYSIMKLTNDSYKRKKEKKLKKKKGRSYYVYSHWLDAKLLIL